METDKEIQTVLRIDHVSRIYSDNEGHTTEALRDINLEVRHGEFLSIIGTSGCGKTTLLRMIGGLDRPQGDIFMLQAAKLRDRIRKEAMCSSRGVFFNG